jgi:hypothetical protein
LCLLDKCITIQATSPALMFSFFSSFFFLIPLRQGCPG